MGNFNPAFYPNYQSLTPEQKQFVVQQYLASQGQGSQVPVDNTAAPVQSQGNGLANMAGQYAGQYAGKYAANSLMGSESVAAAQGAGGVASSGAAGVAGADSAAAAASAGEAGAGATSAAGAAGAGEAGATGIGAAGNFALPALGAYGAYNLIKHQGDAPRGDYARGIGQGAASGAAMGSYFGPWGTLIGGVAGGLVGGIGSATGSTKDKAQMNRDKVRKALQGTGIADKSYMINGLDIGKDGSSTQLQNLGINLGGSKTRHVYDVDFSNPLSGGTVSAVNPLTMALLGQGAKQKQIDDLNGMLTNSVMNGAKDQASINKNIQSLYAKIPGLKTPGLPTGPVAALNAPGVTLGAPGAGASSTRSQTSSPGISKSGQRISYQGHK